MTDSEYAKQKKRLLTLAERWITPLGLKWWKVDLVYARESLDSSKPGWYCQAKTSVSWEYLDAKITFAMPDIVDVSDEALEKIFVHECCHILVNEMRMWAAEEISKEKMDEAMKHEERVVCGLASAFMWTREDGANKLRKGIKRVR